MSEDKNEEKAESIDINTDNRKPYDWESGYPAKARTEMRWEAAYIAVVLLLSFILLICNYLGLIGSLLPLDESQFLQFEYIIYFSSAGLLGGTVYGIKYFYKAVARGYWTQGRRYWRLFSPFISMSVALVIGVIPSANILTLYSSTTNAWAITVGFLAGYFADNAVGKMQEIAKLLFGHTTKE